MNISEVIKNCTLSLAYLNDHEFILTQDYELALSDTNTITVDYCYVKGNDIVRIEDTYITVERIFPNQIDDFGNYPRLSSYIVIDELADDDLLSALQTRFGLFNQID